jgi:hypothetical protein
MYWEAAKQVSVGYDNPKRNILRSDRNVGFLLVENTI